ncbi:hypothetical protein SAMN04488587_0621 [Methanococcoides vulcani]|uniref:Uncharacterized protein n=1 Tax=Methanococcoides vulcani TaxID=1353158 RepID=A0A1H9YJQ5_9EURY|nr:hypothetical protein [Methanococcoides vulcani]SES69275.1 hypothetical protein SAMN04488587_0621 [Methanococcoides vulcani]
MKRRYIHTDGVVYIGKEANNIDMQELEGNAVETYLDIKNFHEWVLGLTPDDVREIGIEHRSTLKRIKDKIKNGKKLNYGKGTVKVLVRYFE